LGKEGKKDKASENKEITENNNQSIKKIRNWIKEQNSDKLKKPLSLYNLLTPLSFVKLELSILPINFTFPILSVLSSLSSWRFFSYKFF